MLTKIKDKRTAIELMAGHGRNYETLREYFEPCGIRLLDASKEFVKKMPVELFKK